MELYDILDKMPVELFFKPSFSLESGLSKIDGTFNVYKIGDELELDTLYYKYPKNFIVLDIGTLKGCIIKDGIVKGVVEEITVEDIVDTEKIYTPKGEELKIDYIEDIYEFKNDFIYYKKEYENLINQKNNILFDIQKNIDKDDFMFIKLKPEIDKIEVKINELQKDYEAKWIEINEYKEDIETFGLYMACLINKMNDFHLIEEVGKLIKDKKEVPTELIKKYKQIDIDNFEKEFDILKDKFSEYLFHHRELNKTYLDWLKLEYSGLSKEYVEIVKDVILNIYDILEN